MPSVEVTIIHGTMSSPNANWFPWLSSELGKKGIKVKIPKFPTPDGQNLGNWLKIFDLEVGPLNSNSILIGHSVGAAFSLRVLERLAQPICATYLVAGFVGPIGNPDFDPLIKTFIDRPFEWDRVKSGSAIFRAYSGDKDPYVARELGLEIVQKLGIELNVIADGGHLNAEAGYTEFPELLEDVIGTIRNTGCVP